MSLGKLERIVDLRTVWKHEAHDFSKWLAKEENINELGKAIGIDITLPELESSVGAFSVDIYATEQMSDRKIIIENQLERTDHEHLGKIITYASGKNAEIIIWIVRIARDEHKQAIEWLNQHTDNDIGFFLIEIELWKIGNSSIAPNFNVVERPNDWTKTIKETDKFTELSKLQLKFWQIFCDKVSENQDFARNFTINKANGRHYHNLNIGIKNCYISLTINTKVGNIGTEIYIPNNKDLYFNFNNNQDLIEGILGTNLRWIEADKACRILSTTEFNIKNCEDNWNFAFEWFIKTALDYKQVFGDFNF